MLFAAAIFLFACTSLGGTTLDRLAINVGGSVITELQIDEELRVAALLSGQEVSRDPASRRAAADRLVDQLLIQHEIEISRYPAPSDLEVATLYDGIEKNMGGADHMRELLEKYNLSTDTLRAHLTAQLATLRFIEFRFRPDVSIADGEVEAAYRKETADLRNPPALDTRERAKLSQALVDERTDAALNSWLAESRKQINIRYRDASLQ